MKNYRRALETILILITINILWWGVRLHEFLGPFATPDSFGSLLSCGGRVAIYLIPILLFLALELVPCYEKGLSLRLQLLAGGYELIVTTLYSLAFECPLLIAIVIMDGVNKLFWWNLAMAYCLLLLHYLNGFWRTALYSSQLGLRRRITMFFFWWIFPINLFLIIRWCRIVRRELITARDRYLLDTARVQNAVCQTRYPVIMVHGICFRDWQHLNYWGRIPKALKQNGAIIYYGRQSSALSVADSAAELKAEIKRVLDETGADKVNIVAHSKGGLDSRYAISMLGLAPCVASLTTINTPHRGCKYADVLLKHLPQGLIRYITRRYNALYYMLGDERPDLLAGVTDLTATACARFNEDVKDAPNVLYQSVASGMKHPRNTFLPLNFTYLFAKLFDGENDGLVSIDSAIWGNYLGEISAGKHRGLSHADIIDLVHRDIKGFDVSEFYVGLLADLKEKGL